MKKILVVANDGRLLKNVKEGLTSLKFDVRTISGQDELFEHIGDFKPDLLVIDFMLGDMNAATLSHQVKSNDDTRELPVIVMTDNCVEGEFASKSGSYSILKKPFSISYLADNLFAALAYKSLKVCY